jgi:gamma-glutamylcyclotransferase (GGCT)/AIG2-like uncharacterized protein YtfP
MNDFLFVYGTLMRTARHAAHRLLEPHAEYVSDGYFVGRLYRAGDYPVAITSPDPDDRVFGELYRVGNAQALFAALDDYEGDAFVRRKVPIHGNGTAVREAWMYVFTGDAAPLARITSGRFD